MALHFRFGLVEGSERGDFEALAEWVRAETGLDLEWRVADSYEDLVRGMRDGSNDVAWLPPVAYALLAEAVTPIGSIARDPGATYACAVVVREDAPPKTVHELAGLRAGWVEPWSAAGYVVPRLELAQAGVIASATFREEKFWGNHRAALLALASGESDVVATYARTVDGRLEGAWSEIEGLSARVLATFGPIPSDVIAVRRNAAPREYQALAKAFEAAASHPDGKKRLRDLFGGDEIHEVASGHASLRRAYERGVARGLFDSDEPAPAS